MDNLNTLNNRYDFVILFDVENGNPNGDPDANNMPRVDFETGHGLVTDVCIKRKIRNYVDIIKGEEDGFNIYIKEGTYPMDNRQRAYKEASESGELKETKDNAGPKDKEDFKKIKDFMCNNFYDVRAFGGVMTLKLNCGQVRGPVQINFAKSIDEISPQDFTITKCTVDGEGKEGKNDNMGKKKFVPYGLYRMEGYVSASLANKTTHFDEVDLNLLWNAIINMFEYDHAASKGKMVTRKLYVFKHATELGNAPSHKLFDLIKINKKDENKIPRAFTDYEITVDSTPEEVTMFEYVDKDKLN